MTRNRNVLLVIPLVALAAIGIAGCAADKTTTASAVGSGGAINAKCSCGTPLDGKTYSMYDGQKIGFCGQSCADEFNAMTDAQKKAEVAKMAKADHPKADHPKGDHPGGEHPK